MRYSILLLLIFLIVGCTSTPEIEGFEKEKWLSDPNGCKGFRKELSLPEKDLINSCLGLNQKEIMSVFGKPDINELYDRSQQFFFYQISPGKECAANNIEGPNRYLSIRFNALGLAKEIQFLEKKYGQPLL